MSIVHSNINSLGYSIAQQDTVRGKSQTVNPVNNFGLRSLCNPEEGSSRQSNHNVQIFDKRTLNITYFGLILQGFHQDWSHKRQMNQQTSISVHRYVKQIDEYSRLNHRDVEGIYKPYLYAQAA